MSRDKLVTPRISNTKKLVFGDVYAGCGGLSLGMLQAGLEGRFAEGAFDLVVIKGFSGQGSLQRKMILVHISKKPANAGREVPHAYFYIRFFHRRKIN